MVIPEHIHSLLQSYFPNLSEVVEHSRPNMDMIFGEHLHWMITDYHFLMEIFSWNTNSQWGSQEKEVAILFHQPNNFISQWLHVKTSQFSGGNALVNVISENRELKEVPNFAWWWQMTQIIGHWSRRLHAEMVFPTSEMKEIAMPDRVFALASVHVISRVETTCGEK